MTEITTDLDVALFLSFVKQFVQEIIGSRGYCVAKAGIGYLKYTNFINPVKLSAQVDRQI